MSQLYRISWNKMNMSYYQQKFLNIIPPIKGKKEIQLSRITDFLTQNDSSPFERLKELLKLKTFNK